MAYHFKDKLRHSVYPIQQDGFFGGCSIMVRGEEGGVKCHHNFKICHFTPPSLSHISHNDKTWHSYSLPKGDTKNI